MYKNIKKTTPTYLYDGDGQVLFIHDCMAVCSDGITRFFKNRHFLISSPPWSVYVQNNSLISIVQPIACSGCNLSGWVRNGLWIDV